MSSKIRYESLPVAYSVFKVIEHQLQCITSTFNICFKLCKAMSVIRVISEGEKTVEATPNQEQIRYWNEQGGPRWVLLQQKLDAQIGPLGLVALQRAAIKWVKKSLMSAAVVARPHLSWPNVWVRLGLF